MRGQPYLIGLLVFTTALFTLAAVVFPNNEVLVVVRSLQVAASFAVVLAYSPALRCYWTRGEMRSPDAILTVAIVMSFLVAGLSSLWLYLWRSADEPRWMVDAAINGYFVCMSAWAAILYASAAGTSQGGVIRATRRNLLMVGIITAVMSAAGLFFPSFFSGLAAGLEPFMAERYDAKDPSWVKIGWRDRCERPRE
jgi:hypothetical protein